MVRGGEYLRDSLCRPAISIGAHAPRHRRVERWVLAEFSNPGPNVRGPRTDQSSDPLIDNFLPLGRFPTDQDRLAEPGRFFLYASAVRNHEVAVGHRGDEVQVA